MRTPTLYLLLPLLGVCGAVLAAEHTYDGHKLYAIVPRDTEQTDLLHRMQQANEQLDFWRLDRFVGSEARVLVPPGEQDKFVATLQANDVRYKEVISDLKRTFYHYLPRPRMPAGLRDPFLKKYLRHDELDAYLEELAAKYPQTVTLTELSKTYEGRSLKTITINGGGGTRNGSRPVVFLDAGIHAREWIAPATAVYVINQLVEHADEHRDILDGLTWIVLPMINPDGYEYSHERQRLWRKTRKPVGNCYGVDGNRNFAFHWGEVGASAQSCAETYRGETAFSELETRAVRDELLRLKGSCKFYLTLHSYGQYLLYPWGWTSALPTGWEDIDEVAQEGARAIEQATGTRYTVGSSTNVLYAASGGSDDYAFAVADVPISITMELPGGGNHGFNPPPSRIAEIVKESFAGIRAMALKVAEKYAH